MEKYESMGSSQRMPSLNDNEVKVYSQHGEDGVLLHIFSKVGVTNRTFVEFGIADGRECNTANLSINFGWNGLLMDTSSQNISKARDYYRKVLSPKSRVRIIRYHVTAENINEILQSNDTPPDLDLLSIDIDGNDYWVWRAITYCRPRVVVIEYNAMLGCTEPITVKYDPNFDRRKKHSSGFYFGASLPALAKLGREKGYVLLGCDSSGVNAFFARQNVAEGKIGDVKAEQAFFADEYWSKVIPEQRRLEIVKHLEFETV